jgi:DNA-binding MarR family transcriptional regulator
MEGWRSPAADEGHADICIGGRCKCGISTGVAESYRGVGRDIAIEGLEQTAILMVRHLAVRTGLGLTANLALGTLEREGPARVTTLAAAASIRQPAMTELVQRLERQSLVTRVDDPGDARAALVTITDTGRALLDDQRRDRRERMAALLKALPADDETTLTLAMHAALPIIRRLIDDAQQSRTQTDGDTPIR